MKWKKVLPPIILLLTLLAFLAFIFLPIHKVFSFTEYRANHPKIYYVRMKNEQEFQIRYVHSIFLTDVIESYKVTNQNAIQLLSMQYENVGIGLPGYAEEGQTLSVKDGLYTLTFLDTIIQSFVLFVGDVDADLAFRYEGLETDLKKHLIRGKSYTFSVQRLSFYQLMKGVKING
ncbi:DUF1850 domain-containing protein [Sporosarcina highlanderae]|uniref:DUF1850 domain-containing protein n=1 Tax=Sporosarcina highlanderae TaxID=3035916 RepID=A0ABT8JR53_9BACL|nr:DUF1850 domain-containing protein [Sporosarcina highlanderae]MDN4606887.1 DUF1850 domain-containing protein [Sporosarcina highlanderae]